MVDANVLWAGVLATCPGQPAIVRGRRGGRTWSPAGPALEASPWGTWAFDILVDPNDPGILWAVVRSNRRDLAPEGALYRGTRDGQWSRLGLGAYEPAPGNVDGVNVAGIAYGPDRNLLFMGCDLSCFNNGNLMLLRSANADAATSSAVSWEVAAHFAGQPAGSIGMARPLAVDAREPRTLFVSTSAQQWGQPLQ